MKIFQINGEIDRTLNKKYGMFWHETLTENQLIRLGIPFKEV